MTEDIKEVMKEDRNEVINEDNKVTTEQDNKEVVPSMDEFKEEIENSFHKVSEGDILKGTVIGISDTEVIVDLGYYTDGIIKLEELSNDPRFSIMADISIGEEVQAEVIRDDDGEGHILLSKKRANDILAWGELKEDLKNKTKYTIKVAEAVNSGVVTYLKGVRAFIPASQISLNYVEDVSTFVGKTLEVIVITADDTNNKLVVSAKEVEREKELADKGSKISKLQRGLVTKGIVDKIVPYGAFVSIGDGLSGLVHISQICGKRIKTPNEVIKEGQEVTVKIIDIKEGKVSLSIKAAMENEEIMDDVSSAAMEYTSDGEVSTGLAGLLANFKFE